MSSKKQVGNNASKKDNVKKIVFEDSDNESVKKTNLKDESSDSESSDSSDDESDDDSDDEEEKDKIDEKINKVSDIKTPKTKEKVKRISQDELLKELVETNDNLYKVRETRDKLNKEENVLQKKADKIVKLLQKNEVDNNKSQNKEKKERKKSTSGINDDTKPVPEKLRKFLKLDNDATMARTKLGSLLNNKFKELGLKEGKIITLDKKTAKYFGLEEGHEIPFSGPTGFQAFLKNVYNDEKTDVKL